MTKGSASAFTLHARFTFYDMFACQFQLLTSECDTTEMPGCISVEHTQYGIYTRMSKSLM